MRKEIVVDPLHDLRHTGRVYKVIASHLQRSRSRLQISYRILSGGNPAACNDWNTDCGISLPNQEKILGKNSQARKPSADIPQDRPLSVNIDKHGPESITDRNCIRPGILRRFRTDPDVRNIRRKLCNKRQRCLFARLRNRLIEEPSIGRKWQAAAHIRAGEVHLNGSDPRVVVDDLKALGLMAWL